MGTHFITDAEILAYYKHYKEERFPEWRARPDADKIDDFTVINWAEEVTCETLKKFLRTL